MNTSKKQPVLLRLLLVSLVAALLVGAYFVFPWLRTRVGRMSRLAEWFRNPTAHPDWAVQAGARCGEAPFILPTSGYVGFIWGDSFSIGHRHQGIDIFGGDQPGQTPMLAAYPGYLTRLPEWKSTVIIRIPSDPFSPHRQVWVYYTHMADKDGASYISAEFPAGTRELPVHAGTLLGYQGDYSGDPNNPVGVHLHFSIVQDDDQGSFKNELEIGNTLDPSQYLGLPLNAGGNHAGVVTCISPGDG